VPIPIASFRLRARTALTYDAHLTDAIPVA
jgi:hypothetical protein